MSAEAGAEEKSDRNPGSKMGNSWRLTPASHFPDGKTECLRRKGTCSVSHSWRPKSLGPEPRTADLKPVLFLLFFFFLLLLESPPPLSSEPPPGPSWPLASLLNGEGDGGKAPSPHVHTATLSQEARNKFFFSGNALLPSLQNNVFIIAKPFPSLRRKCIPHDSPKPSGPGLQIQHVNSFVNIYSG